MRKRIVSLAALLALLCAVCLPVSAHEVPDTDRTGSISIQMTYQDKAVPGGSLTLYRVGEVSENDGNYSFVPTGDFKDCGLSFADVTVTALPGELAVYAAEHSIKGTTEKIDSEGKVCFKDLELGLYLLVQSEAAEGYNALSAFLVTVPTNEDGKYIYDVNAAPKVQLTPAEPKPTEEETEPTKPTGPTLPQTGQLNWPVPLLAVAGIGLFILGFAMKFKRKSE